jgi:hypothetical protein
MARSTLLDTDSKARSSTRGHISTFLFFNGSPTFILDILLTNAFVNFSLISF